MNAYAVTREFERALCDYTGAPYAVAVTSCTMALLLAVAYHRYALGMDVAVEIPKRTYVGVPHSILNANIKVSFRDEEWQGYYQLKPLPVWDSARWFTTNIYANALLCGGGKEMPFVCVSFHSSKTLGDTQGGAILHGSPEADAWLRRARFDGRSEGVAPKDDKFDMPGWHAYLSPDVSARLLWKLSSLPPHNAPLPWGPGTDSDYPDLSFHEAFK